MRPEMMVLLLVGYFVAFLVVRKYFSIFLYETTDILAWQHEYSHGRVIDGGKDKWKHKFSFCKNIESRKIQVT